MCLLHCLLNYFPLHLFPIYFLLLISFLVLYLCFHILFVVFGISHRFVYNVPSLDTDVLFWPEYLIFILLPFMYTVKRIKIVICIKSRDLFQFNISVPRIWFLFASFYLAVSFSLYMIWRPSSSKVAS